MIVSTSLKIFDCFLFNGEFDILELRLKIMAPFVNQFVLIEAGTTFTGLPKQNLFQTQAIRFSEYGDKLKVISLQKLPSTNNAWENEFFMRNALLENFPGSDNDLIIVSDVDEILNLKQIFTKIDSTKSYIVQIPCLYYFANLQSSELFSVTYLGPFCKIKNRDIGNRLLFSNFVDEILKHKEKNPLGMHLTYQFGYDVESYQEKIRSFSHQEFNTNYFTNSKRINKVIFYYYDLFERWNFQFKYVPTNDFSAEIKSTLMQLPANKIKWGKASFVTRLFRPFYLLSIKSYRSYFFNNFKRKLVSIRSKIVKK